MEKIPNISIRNHQEARVEAYWTEEEIRDRLTILARYRDGWDDPTWGRMLYPKAFPDGFDPVTHAYDDIVFLEAELNARRTP